ncbi:MAG: stage II sporulation protein M [Proteobacteria bacterium]|nr:stage II sporulation protein M [Pseudomonadota bacterium]
MHGPAQITLKSYEFRREREPTWLALEALVERAQKSGFHSLSADELARLPHLYRATLSSLSVARSISLDRNVVEYLESLAGRAYFFVYGTRSHARDVLAEFVLYRFPAGIRRFKWHIGLAALFVIVGALTAFFITLDNQERFYTFVAEEYAQGRGPSSSTSELRAVLYSEHSPGDALATFAASLFTHNAKIGIVSFSLGVVIGLPVFLLMFINGLVLGAFAALHHARGLSADLWGWLLPHGVTELGAMVICGGLGLALAQALIFPGRSTRLRNLAQCGRQAGVVVVGAVIMFFIAGLIEGIFRQLVTDIAIRYAVAVITAVAWSLYFGLVGRSRDSARAEVEP